MKDTGKQIVQGLAFAFVVACYDYMMYVESKKINPELTFNKKVFVARVSLAFAAGFVTPEGELKSMLENLGALSI